MSATSAPARAARAYTKAAQTPSLGAIYDNRPAAIAMPNWGMDALRDCLEHDPAAQEVLENGAFLFLGRSENDRDMFVYERVSRNGSLLSQPARLYKLTTTGPVVWDCDCPSAQKLRGEETDQRRYCKHVRALQAELREAFERIRRTASALCPPQKRGQGADFDRSDWRS